jgi:hypothetical protein
MRQLQKITIYSSYAYIQQMFTEIIPLIIFC